MSRTRTCNELDLCSDSSFNLDYGYHHNGRVFLDSVFSKNLSDNLQLESI